MAAPEESLWSTLRPVLAAVIALVALASIGVLARYTSDKDKNRLKTRHEDAATACRRLQAASPTSAQLEAAIDAFTEDKQLVLVLQAKKVASAADEAARDAALDEIRRSCREVYLRR